MEYSSTGKGHSRWTLTGKGKATFFAAKKTSDTYFLADVSIDGCNNMRLKSDGGLILVRPDVARDINFEESMSFTLVASNVVGAGIIVQFADENGQMTKTTT